MIATNIIKAVYLNYDEHLLIHDEKSFLIVEVSRHEKTSDLLSRSGLRNVTIIKWDREDPTQTKIKDVIFDILKSSGSLSKTDILKLVSEKRFVKPNTIAINLENKKYFKKLPDGRYNIA